MPSREQGEQIIKRNEEMFNSAIWMRGLSYYSEGKALLTFCDGKEIHADVLGSHKYSVRLDFDGYTLKKAKCNCPYDRGLCKHEAAALIAFAYSDYVIDKEPVRVAAAEMHLTSRQFVTKLNLLLAREYNINAERYYTSAVAVYEATLPYLDEKEKIDRFSLIFSTSANSKLPERGGQGAHWLIKMTAGRGFSVPEKAEVVYKVSVAFVYSSYLYELFLSEEYREAMGVAFVSPKGTYDYPFSKLFYEYAHRIIPSLTDDELKGLLNPALKFPDTDLVLTRLKKLGKLEEVLGSLSDDAISNLGIHDVSIAVSLMKTRPEIAQKILWAMFNSYDCDFRVIYYLFSMLDAQQRSQYFALLRKRADHLDCSRAFSIMVGERYTVSTVRYLSFEEVMLLGERIIRDHGDKAKPAIASVIKKQAEKNVYEERDLIAVLDALDVFSIDPKDGLLSPEIIGVSYTCASYRVEYLRRVKNHGLLRATGLRRHEV